MRVVSLTGGIGAGKTLVSNLFADLGVPVIDADRIAHELTAIGSPAWRTIKRKFGAGFFLPDGRLDRRKLRDEVFSNPASLKRLEAILHPLIREGIRQAIADADLANRNTAYCIVSIPLLIEADMLDLGDEVVVVDVPEALQIQRVMARDGASREDVEKILDRQATREQRLAIADHVIDNSTAPETTREQVEALDRILRDGHSNRQ